MTTTLQTLTSRLKGDQARAGAATGRRAVRRGLTRRGASSAAMNRIGVAGFGPLPQSMPPRTR